MASFALTSPVSFQVVACDLLDKFDDVSPQPWLLYPHERLSERERVGYPCRAYAFHYESRMTSMLLRRAINGTACLDMTGTADHLAELDMP